MWMAKFAPRATEEEIRSARRRIAAGESKRSVARSLGYSGSSPHKALQQRIDSQERREELERMDRHADRAAADAEKKRVARGVRTGYAEIARTSDRPEERGGTNVSADIDRVRVQLESDDHQARRERLRQEEAQAVAERANRRARFGFAPNSGKTYRDPESAWLQEKDDLALAELEHQHAHPEEYARYHLITLDGRKVGAKTGYSAACETAERLALRLGPVEPVPANEYALTRSRTNRTD
jgi:hypothetical protein